MTLLSVALVSALLGCGRASPAAPVEVPPATGTSSDGSISWAWHRDLNALEQVVPAGEHLVTRTRSGDVAVFSTADLSLLGATADGSTTALAIDGSGRVVRARSDGRVGLFDPAALEDGAEIARLPGPVDWLVPKGEGWLAAATGPGRTYRLHTLPSGRSGALPAGGNARLVVGDTLWIGVDKGEWGGQVIRYDLASLSTAARHDLPSGVYGFSEGPDGAVLAFGGMLHMGMSSAFVARVDGAAPQTVWESETVMERTGTPTSPRLPISLVVPAGDDRIVVSYGEVFRADPALKRFTYLGRSELRYNPGRPDAMGSYPASRSALWVNGVLVLATVRDGLVRALDGTSSRVGGQLGLVNPFRVVGTEDGFWVTTPLGERTVWQHRDNGWEELDLAPDHPTPDRQVWLRHQAATMPSGPPVVVSQTNGTPGPLVTHRGGETLAVETTRIGSGQVFVTPDGSVWRNLHDALLVLEGDTWTEVGPPAAPGRIDAVVGPPAGPWLLLDRSGGLHRLHRSPVRAEPVADGVRDIAACPDGELVALSDVALDGVRVLDLPGTVLACDGKGRVWVASKDALWFGTGEAMHRVDGRPGLGKTVMRMAGRPDGVVLTLVGAVLELRAP